MIHILFNIFLSINVFALYCSTGLCMSCELAIVYLVEVSYYLIDVSFVLRMNCLIVHRLFCFLTVV